jgi:DNA mismatch repair protein MutS
MSTPLMRQYQQVKAKYPDTVLLFRMGDFFETFDEVKHRSRDFLITRLIHIFPNSFAPGIVLPSVSS